MYQSSVNARFHNKEQKVDIQQESKRWAKINLDGASKGNPCKARTAGVIKNNQRQLSNPVYPKHWEGQLIRHK